MGLETLASLESTVGQTVEAAVLPGGRYCPTGHSQVRSFSELCSARWIDLPLP